MMHAPGNPPPAQGPVSPEWPQAILDRIHRVFEYHQTTKVTYENCRQRPAPGAKSPPVFRTFDSAEKVALPTNLIAADAATISLILDGRSSLPESQLDPPHNLRTLATWLFYADGVLGRQTEQRQVTWLRTLWSNGETYPCEIYVAAFAIEGLNPGLYYYSPREFVLRRLRDGLGVLSHLKRGRPDLEFLKSVPVALLVSTVFSRSTWLFHKRGYRTALLDAGHTIENLIQAGTALGMQTQARLRMNDATTRELIGVPANVSFDDAESVQAMVVWSDPTPKPVTAPPGAAGPMPPIARPAHQFPVTPYDTIIATHEDCVAPGVAIREIRPPLTDLSPLAPNIPAYERPPVDEPRGGRPLGPMLMKRPPALKAFARKAIPRDPFLAISRLAFRRSSYYPLVADAAHVALVRPLWILHDVLGMDSGVWYYHPQSDRWSMLGRGNFRVETAYLSREQALAGDAAAVCVMIANVHLLLQQAGPDTYRLAHLEAGIAAQRMQLLAEAQNLAAIGNTSFYDDELRKFFGLEHGGWEIIYQVLVGEPFDPGADQILKLTDAIDDDKSDEEEEDDWRD
ncbi:MAG TPA: SagB/ThcOx family dehydrogenase [Tepidisphaeraceae bacterium]|jgi:SagB-type dehydrogenase family enzyme